MLNVSGHYNNGLKIDNSTRVDGLIELTGSGYVINGAFSHANGVFHFTKTNNFNIVSTTLYETHYTFFFIASQDIGKKGRLFTSNIGNRLFGYWDDKYGSLWIDININVNGKGVNDGKRYLFTLRNDNGKKTAFINNEQYIDSSNGGRYWGKVVIGTSLNYPGEAGIGNVCEVICFNRALNNSEITTINEKLFKYYPII